MSQSAWYSFRDEVKSSFTCLQYLNHYCGKHIFQEGKAICAPSFIRTGDDSPSFGVWDHSCYDFATDTSYDVIDLCALHKFNGDTTAALEFLAGRPLPSASAEGHRINFNPQLQKFQQRIDYWHQQLNSSQQARDYLASRFISEKTAALLKLGFSPNQNRLMIPFFSHHGKHPPVFVTGRDLSGEHQLKYRNIKLHDEEFSEILQHVPYGIHSVRPGFFQRDTLTDNETGGVITLDSHNIRYDYLCITEGIFDVISFLQDGWASFSGKISSSHVQDVISICTQYRDKGQNIFLCFDNDKAGQTFQLKLGTLLLNHRIPFTVGVLPSVYEVTRKDHPQYGHRINIKDVNDFYAAGGSLEQLVNRAKPGTAFLAEHCSNENEIKQLFHDIARFYPSDSLNLLHAYRAAARRTVEGETTETVAADGHIVIEKQRIPLFDPESLKEMFMNARKPLTDGDIADMVLQKYKLKLDTTGQFYEYSFGVWTPVAKFIVEHYISNVMNGKISANKIGNVRKYLAANLAEKVDFNARPLFVFRNGTLWLDEPAVVMEEGGVKKMNRDFPLMPLNFRPHNPEDLCTISVDYDYDPKAVNQPFLDALNVWLEGDQQKIKRAQEMAGYILFSDCTLQKFCMLLGDGGNGKSTYLHALEAVFGRDNCTSLQVARFSSQFDPIMLKNSIANFSYDAKTDITGSEETLKAIASGDAIVAAHKGIDAETFRSRAKLFIAANRHLSANDISRGLIRRILFLKFNKIFDDNEVDPFIEDDLLKDLPGLFNWIYQGYLDLKKQRRFSPTDEEKEMFEEFKEQLSGTLTFYREFLRHAHDKTYSDAELYGEYRSWCADAGVPPLNRMKFIADIRQVIRVERNEDIKVYRDPQFGRWTFECPYNEDWTTQQLYDELLEEEDDDGEQASGGQANESAPAKKAPKAIKGSTAAHTVTIPLNEAEGKQLLHQEQPHDSKPSLLLNGMCYDSPDFYTEETMQIFRENDVEPFNEDGKATHFIYRFYPPVYESKQLWIDPEEGKKQRQHEFENFRYHDVPNIVNALFRLNEKCKRKTGHRLHQQPNFYAKYCVNPEANLKWYFEDEQDLRMMKMIYAQFMTYKGLYGSRLAEAAGVECTLDLDSDKVFDLRFKDEEKKAEEVLDQMAQWAFLQKDPREAFCGLVCALHYLQYLAPDYCFGEDFMPEFESTTYGGSVERCSIKDWGTNLDWLKATGKIKGIYE